MVDRTTRERFAKLILEKRIREERLRQSNPRGGLMEFIRYFWPVLEPVDPFVEGWVVECMCAHLEAMARKETIVLAGKERQFNRLWINVPPGMMKSLLTNVFYPAWLWGPMNQPHLRFVAFSYAAELTERDNAKFRDLVTSEAYRELWGHVFSIVGDGKVRITNDKTGFKFASSIGGVGTGERGHYVLCFPAEQTVWTENGPRPIVDVRIGERVWTYNAEQHQLELVAVQGTHKNPGRPLVRITTQSGAQVTCTHDHEIYSEYGRVPAASLVVGDLALAAASRMVVPGANVRLSQVQPEMLPRAAAANVGDGAAAYLKHSGKLGCRGIWHRRNLPHMIFSKVRRAIFERSVPLAVSHILRARAVLKIAKRRVSSIAVLVTNLLTQWARSNESFGNKAVAQAIVSTPVLAKRDAWISVIQRARQHLASPRDGVVSIGVRSTIGISAKSATTGDNATEAANAPHVGDLVGAFKSHNSAPFFDRIVSVEFLHEVPSSTYCLTVGRTRSLICGDLQAIVCSNCDDIHKLKGQHESDEARQATVNWVLEAMQNRLNDLQRDAIIGVMQRVHESDASGAIQKQLYDQYCNLIVPMEYVPGVHFSHYTGWNGGQDPRQQPGELAWPERYPEHVIAPFRRNAYLWSGQYQQDPVPRGGGLFKEDWWQPYEIPASGTFDFPGGRPLFCIASLDTAVKETEENDYSALTVWGVYDDPKTGNRRIMLMDAWKKRLPLNGERVARRQDEDERSYMRRASVKWGLVEWTAFTCSRRNVDVLIIEDTTRATDVNNEIRRLYGQRDWGVELIKIRGDKWVRAQAVLSLFTDEMIYAPGQWVCHTHGKAGCKDPDCSGAASWDWRPWAQEVIGELCSFPRGAHDDLVDSVSMGLAYLRRRGLAIRREEREAVEEEFLRYKAPSKPLY